VLEQLYDAFPRYEEAFHDALDESLHPRGPEVLFELVERMGLPPGSRAADVGCGEGRHSLELARRFGFSVVGVDPVPRHVEVARASAESGVRFELGAAEKLPLEEASVDLVWCRDVLVHVADLERAYLEFRRVLRPGGRALVYQPFAGPRLEPREAAWLWGTLGVVPASAEPSRAEAAISASGLRVDESIDLSEWGESAEETSGKGGRRLLWASRLLRDPQRYLDRFGQAAYETMLADCLWHVYGMIGKLDRRAYVLTKVP
jgi:SAM-dependent methyltransferase